MSLNTYLQDDRPLGEVFLFSTSPAFANDILLRLQERWTRLPPFRHITSHRVTVVSHRVLAFCGFPEDDTEYVAFIQCKDQDTEGYKF